MATKPKRPYTIVRGGKLLDIAKRKAAPADILIKGDTIAAIGRPGLAAPAGATVIDARHRLMHPGLINAHTHGPGNLGKGMGDRWSLELLLTASPWINIGRTLEDKYLVGHDRRGRDGDEGLHRGLRPRRRVPPALGRRPVGHGQGLRGGRHARRAGADGGRPHLLRGDPRPDGAPAAGAAEGGRELPLRAVEGHHQADEEGAAEVAVREGPCWRWRRPSRTIAATTSWSPAATSPSEYDVGIHSHVAESKVQVSRATRRYGTSLAAHMDELGLVNDRFTVAHGVWLDDDDMKRLGDRGASVAHNPGSNMRLGNGLADVRGMLNRKVNVGVGTDGASCSDNQNMYEAMRLASFGLQGPGAGRGSSWLTTEEALRAATEGSARALGLDKQIGRIAPGYKADIVFLDLHHINWIPTNDPVNALVHTEDGTGVHSVMIGGRMVVENRKLLTVDLPKLAAKAEAVARAAREDHRRRRRSSIGRLEKVVGTFCPGLAKAPLHIHRYGASHHAH